LERDLQVDLDLCEFGLQEIVNLPRCVLGDVVHVHNFQDLGERFCRDPLEADDSRHPAALDLTGDRPCT